MKSHRIKTYQSPAKLMLSGEYTVLKGALSLALPLKYGQTLKVEECEGKSAIHWQSMINEIVWFSATILLPDFKVIVSNLPKISDTLLQILIAAKELNPGFLKLNHEYRVTSGMNFDPSWGIGSSSSLISNIAWWAGCDPFILNKKIFSGSGYDIACARSSYPIIYKVNENQPVFRKAYFRPHFHRNLYFIYLNRKQDTRKSILKTDLSSLSNIDINTISELTLGLEKAECLADFQDLMDQHEELTGRIIGQTPVKELLFSDFNGSVKSLGAWGGDFILAASGSSEKHVREYFIGKNLFTIFNYSDFVIEPAFSGQTLKETGNPVKIRQVQNG